MPLKTAVFTTTTDWPVPASVSAVWAMWLGAGAGGAASPGTNLSPTGASEGGGGGEMTLRRLLSCTPGGTVSIIIGAGGTAGQNFIGGNLPTAGGATSVSGYSMLGGLASTNNVSHANGGGPNGGSSFLSGGATANIDNGTLESPTAFGGCGAGLGGTNGSTDGIDRGADGKLGQVIGQYESVFGTAVPACHGGGGNGAPSILGPGGTGGTATDANNGAGATASTPGTGGGGACGTGTCTPIRAQIKAGGGAPGYAMLMWTEPT